MTISKFLTAMSLFIASNAFAAAAVPTCPAGVGLLVGVETAQMDAPGLLSALRVLNSSPFEAKYPSISNGSTQIIVAIKMRADATPAGFEQQLQALAGTPAVTAIDCDSVLHF